MDRRTDQANRHLKGHLLLITKKLEEQTKYQKKDHARSISMMSVFNMLESNQIKETSMSSTVSKYMLIQYRYWTDIIMKDENKGALKTRIISSQFKG